MDDGHRAPAQHPHGAAAPRRRLRELREHHVLGLRVHADVRAHRPRGRGGRRARASSSRASTCRSSSRSELLAALQDAYSKYTTVKGIQDLPETDTSTTSLDGPVALAPRAAPSRCAASASGGSRARGSRAAAGSAPRGSSARSVWKSFRRRRGVARRVQRPPVRLGLVAARDDVLRAAPSGARARVSTRIAYGRFVGPAEPAAPARRERERATASAARAARSSRSPSGCAGCARARARARSRRPPRRA